MTDSMQVILFLTAMTNLLIGVINLITIIINSGKKKKRPFPKRPARQNRKGHLKK